MRGYITVKPCPLSTNFPVFNGDTVGAEEIADWMSSDLQLDIRHIDEMIETFSAFAREKKPGACLGYGNAHGVFVHEHHVYIECEFDDDQRVLLTTDQAIKALKAYRRCLLGGGKPGKIPVSYIAEGEDAELQFLDIADVDDLSDIVARGEKAHFYS